MNVKILLLGTATCALLAGTAFAQTDAAPADAPKHHHHHHADSTGSDRFDLLEKQVQEQAQEIQDLKAQMGQQAQQPSEVSATQFEALQNQVYETEAAVKSAAEPHDKKLHMKGVTFTFGGFLAMESVWRSNNLESDIGSPGYSSIPFPGPGGQSSSKEVTAADIYHMREFRFTARQSRVSGLVEGDVDPDTHLSGYGEFDFLGAAASANSKESNSYTPRIRNLYGAVDWSDIGVHFLFGQSWSLATLDAKGISERSELAPPTIEAQYVAGFVWTRQPQLRVVKDFGDGLWVGVSLENPQTTISGTAPSGVNIITTNSTSFQTGPNGTTSVGTTNNTADAEFNPGIQLSVNQMPDVVGKIAWEPDFFDGNVHLEAVGILRQFYDRVGASGGSKPQNTYANHTTTGGGGGVAGLIKVVPGLLDVQFDTLFGSGIGRYGSSQLPDTTYNTSGTLHPISENMEMAGITLHATPDFDVYVFGGREADSKALGKGSVGYGNPAVDVTNCSSYNDEYEISSGVAKACGANVQSVEQINVGLWDKLYNGDYGSLRFGLQYSYTYLKAFEGTNKSLSPSFLSAPHTSDNMIFTSFRYYPF